MTKFKNVLIFPLNAALIILAGVLFVLAFTSKILTAKAYSYGGYYMIFGLFLIWAVTIIQCLYHYRPALKKFFAAYKYGLMISLIFAVVIFVSVKSQFGVLSDETNLVAVSKTMTYERRTDNITMGKWYYDLFFPIKREPPTRPLLFPFLTHLIHTVSGYRPENVFALNFLVLYALFFLIFAAMKRHFGDVSAAAAVILTAAQPIISQIATSGGFDLLPILFLVICFLSLEWFLKEPSALRLQLLWVNLLMFANVRYEGGLLFLVVMFLLAVMRDIKLEHFKGENSVVYFFTPLVFLLFVWARVLIPKQFTEADQALFSVSYFTGNCLNFLKTFCDLHYYFPYAAIVNIIGIISLIHLGRQFFLRRVSKDKYQRHLIIIAGIYILLNWTLFMLYFFGRVDHPASARFFAVFSVVLSVFAAVLPGCVGLFRQKPAYIMVFSLVMFALYHPLSVEDRYSLTQTLPRKYRFVMDFLEKEGGDRKSFVVVDGRPGQYTVHNYGAVDFNYANSTDELISGLKNHLYNEIFVVQDIEYAGMKPVKWAELNAKYVLETLSEMQNEAGILIRISRVRKN